MSSSCLDATRDPTQSPQDNSFCRESTPQLIAEQEESPSSNCSDSHLADSALAHSESLKIEEPPLKRIRSNSTEESCSKSESCVPHDACSWTGKISQLDSHISECEYSLIRCPYERCGISLRRKDLKEHQEECASKVSPCPSCGVSQKQSDLDEHMTACRATLLPCPNRCKEGSDVRLIPRSSIPSHMLECPNISLACPYAAVGCCQRGSRSELREHMRDGASHINTLVKAVVTQGKRLAHVSEQLSIRTSELVHLKDSLSEAKNWTHSEIIWQIPSMQICRSEFQIISGRKVSIAIWPDRDSARDICLGLNIRSPVPTTVKFAFVLYRDNVEIKRSMAAIVHCFNGTELFGSPFMSISDILATGGITKPKSSFTIVADIAVKRACTF